MSLAAVVVLALVVASLGAYAIAYAAVLLSTRPEAVQAGPGYAAGAR